MTRFLLAATLFLAFSAPAFAVSDEQVRQLAASLQNSSAVFTTDQAFTPNDASFNSMSMTTEVSPVLANYNDITQLTAEEGPMEIAVCVCGAQISDDAFLDDPIMLGPPGTANSN